MLSPAPIRTGVPPAADQPATLPRTGALPAAATSLTAVTGLDEGIAFGNGWDTEAGRGMPSAEAFTFCSGALTEPVVAVSARPVNGLPNGLSENRRVSELQAPDMPAMSAAPMNLRTGRDIWSL